VCWTFTPEDFQPPRELDHLRAQRVQVAGLDEHGGRHLGREVLVEDRGGVRFPADALVDDVEPLDHPLHDRRDHRLRRDEVRSLRVMSTTA
jgi:hypothetical protein